MIRPILPLLRVGTSQIDLSAGYSSRLETGTENRDKFIMVFPAKKDTENRRIIDFQRIGPIA